MYCEGKKVKYVCETIQEYRLEKATVDDEITGMERAYGLTKNIYEIFIGTPK